MSLYDSGRAENDPPNLSVVNPGADRRSEAHGTCVKGRGNGMGECGDEGKGGKEEGQRKYGTWF